MPDLGMLLHARLTGRFASNRWRFTLSELEIGDVDNERQENEWIRDQENDIKQSEYTKKRVCEQGEYKWDFDKEIISKQV